MCVCPVVARVRVGPITVFESVSAARPPPPHPPASLKMLSFGNACGRSPRAPAEAPPPRAECPRPRRGVQPRLLLSMCGARGAHDGAAQGWSTVCAPVQARRLLLRAWALAVPTPVSTCAPVPTKHAASRKPAAHWCIAVRLPLLPYVPVGLGPCRLPALGSVLGDPDRGKYLGGCSLHFTQRCLKTLFVNGWLFASNRHETSRAPRQRWARGGAPGGCRQ